MNILALVAAILLVSFSAQSAQAEGVSSTYVNENDPRELRLAAFQKYLEGDFPGASSLYERAIAAARSTYGKDSSFVADLCYEVGTISLEDGQFQTAEKYLKMAVQHKPNSVMARVKYADLLAMRGLHGDAFTQIQEALKISPGSPIAQQALVKWMMSQSNHRTEDGAIANVAATWECFRLRAMGKNSVQATMADISNWRNGFLKQKSTAATVAMTPPPKIKPVAKSAVEMAPPPPQIAKAKPKPKVKPVERPVTALKPKVEKPKPVEKPAEQAEVKVAKAKPEKRVVVPPPPSVVASAPVSKKSKNGLVPPPPPGPVFGGGYPPAMMMPPPPSGFVLKTTAEVKDPEKPKKKKPKPAAAAPEGNDEDPDYLLDWASDDKKK